MNYRITINKNNRSFFDEKKTLYDPLKLLHNYWRRYFKRQKYYFYAEVSLDGLTTYVYKSVSNDSESIIITELGV